MTLMRDRVINFAGAVLVPMLIEVVLLILFKEFPSMAWARSPASLFISSSAGFVFLIREYRLWSLVVALAYFPAMTFFLFWFGLMFVGLVYGDSL